MPHNRPYLHRGVACRLRRGTAIALLFLLAGTLAGCAKPAGVIFEPPATPIAWPQGDEPARIRYVGQLTGSADLKPGVSMGQRLGQMMFGRAATHSMLSPYAVCTDGRGRLFVADSNAQIVHVFNLENRVYQQWTPGRGLRFSQPVGIAYSGGRLYVADSIAASIFVFDDNGHLIREIGGERFVRPAGLAYDRHHRRLFVADVGAHQVIVLDDQGQLIASLGQRGTGPGEFNFPTNVAVDRAGRLYVSDSLNFRIHQFGPDLTFLRQIGSKGDRPGYFGQPKGIATDSENHLYVVDANFEAVQIFDQNGTLLLSFGQEGRRAGEFWLPSGIHIDSNDRIWVADGYNRRVQVFDYLAEARP